MTCSCGRSTPSASGSATTTCSPTTCAAGWSATAPTGCRGCTGARRCGSPGHDLVPEAVTHALAAGDVERATDLVERHAMALVEHSRMVSLLGLTARLPADAVDARPRLLMAVAWANCLLQRPEAAQLALDHLRRVAAGAAERTRRCTARPTSCRPASTSTATAPTAPRRWSAAAWSGTGPTGRGSSRSPPTSRRSATSTRCGFRDALERQRWARPFHDRTIGPFAGVYGRCFAGHRRVRPARPGRGRGTLVRCGRPGPRLGGPPLARRAAGGRAAGRAALRTRRARRGRAAAGGEPGAGRGERGRRLHGRDLRLLARIKAHRGADADSAELLAEGAKVAERLGLTRLRAAVLAERIRQLLAARRVREARWVAQDLPDGGGCPGGIGVADRPDPHRFAGRGAVRRGRPRRGRRPCSRS